MAARRIRFNESDVKLSVGLTHVFGEQLLKLRQKLAFRLLKEILWEHEQKQRYSAAECLQLVRNVENSEKLTTFLLQITHHIYLL